jgi:hypothetical protein
MVPRPPQQVGIEAVKKGWLGGLGGTLLVAGVRWSFRGKDAGSVRSQGYGRD